MAAGFHWFLRDVAFLFLSWDGFRPSQDDAELASCFLNRLYGVCHDYGNSAIARQAKLQANLYVCRVRFG